VYITRIAYNKKFNLFSKDIATNPYLLLGLELPNLENLVFPEKRKNILATPKK